MIFSKPLHVACLVLVSATLTALVVQTEDVLVDTRGYIYISHKNQGIWVLRYTGD